ncbi:MAG: HD domain-containing protein [Candidatus Thorarchaeota archaeon]
MVDLERLSQQMQFIIEIDKLKHIERQSALTDGTRQENDSEHSWHIATMAILLSEYSNKRDIDLFKVIKMLLIHDLVEIDAGDTFLYDTLGNSTKAKREKDAAERIFGLLPEDQATEMHSLWLEYEARETPEARFAFAMDAIQPLLLSFHNRGWSWKKHSVVKSQIVDKKEPLKIGSEGLWEYAQTLIEEAVKEGFLIDDEGH